MQSTDLAALRERINALDHDLRDLFLARMQLSAEVAASKRASGLPVLDAAREQAVLDRVAEGLDAASAEAVQALWRQIMALSRAYQHRLLNREDSAEAALVRRALAAAAPLPDAPRVACGGRPGAYADHACHALFASPDVRFFATWREVCDALERGECDYGVLPVENSTCGSVTEVYRLLCRRAVRIVRACRLPVHHALLGVPGAALEEVREVRSHPQALGQCAAWLEEHPQIRSVEVSNTAAAAETVAKLGQRELCALASPDCAALYGLSVLCDDVTDRAYNCTRFLCLAPALHATPDADRLSLIITLPHRPGTLAALLDHFARYGLNLTKLESAPIPGEKFAYSFCIDLEAPSPEVLPGLLDDLGDTVESLEVLGVYRELR